MAATYRPTAESSPRSTETGRGDVEVACDGRGVLVDGLGVGLGGFEALADEGETVLEPIVLTIERLQVGEDVGGGPGR